MKKNIAVITGGEASERGISLKSAEVVCKHLNHTKYQPYKVVIDGIEWNVHMSNGEKFPVDKNDFTVIIQGKKIHFDTVFIAIHGTPAEDGKLQGYFDMLKIPYNACGVLQAALTFDKQRCKEVVSSYGVRVAKAELFRKGHFIDWEDIKTNFPFPAFVKPNKNGSSYGASKVDSVNDVEAAVTNAFEYDDEVLLEEYLSGVEVTCGVIKLNGKITALPVTEIRSKSNFFDYKAKYEGHAQEITPAELASHLTEGIQRTSVMIYEKLGFKGMCRIDYIITPDTFYMLEVNSVPGLSEESIIPQQARVAGLTLQELFDKSVEDGLK